MIIISSIYIANITPSILKHALGSLVSFANFHGPEDNPFGSTTNFKKFFPAWNFKHFESSSDIFTE